MKRLLLSVFVLLTLVVWARSAHAASSTISGVVSNIDGTTCNLCTVGFSSLTTQTISGTAYQPKFVTTTTDIAGNLAPITLPQGLAVQITVSEGGTTFPAFTAIIPFLSTATFNQLNQGVLLNPLNVLASQQPPTGPLSMNSQKITTLACPSNSGDALAWGCNATVNNLTVTGGFTQNTSGAAFFGLLSVTKITDPSAPTVVAVGTTGSTTYTYFVACHDGNGGSTLASSGTTITNGNATLNGTNYNQVTFTIPTHALNCDILKTDTSHSVALAQTASPYLDQGAGSSVYTAPTRNTTGDGQFGGAVTAGSFTSTIATGDMSAARSAGTGKHWFGSNGSQSLDFGITNASSFTLVGGGLVLPTGALAVTNNETVGTSLTVGTTLGVTGATTLTGGLVGTLALNGAVSGSAGIKAASTGTPTTLVLPSANASANQTLLNDGSGNLSWTSGLTIFDRSVGNPAVDVVNTGAETSIYSKSIPGNTLGSDGALRVTFAGDSIDSSGSDSTIQFKVKFGGTTVLDSTAIPIQNNANHKTNRGSVLIANLGATNSQQVSGTLLQGGVSTPAGGTATNGLMGTLVNSAVGEYAGLAIDTTTAQTLQITVTLGTANAALEYRSYQVYVELLVP